MHISGMNGCASTDSSILFILTSAFWMRNKDTAYCGSHGYRVARAKTQNKNHQGCIVLHVTQSISSKNEQSCSLFCQNWRKPVRREDKKCSQTWTKEMSLSKWKRRSIIFFICTESDVKYKPKEITFSDIISLASSRTIFVVDSSEKNERDSTHSASLNQRICNPAQ